MLHQFLKTLDKLGLEMQHVWGQLTYLQVNSF